MEHAESQLQPLRALDIGQCDYGNFEPLAYHGIWQFPEHLSSYPPPQKRVISLLEAGTRTTPSLQGPCAAAGSDPSRVSTGPGLDTLSCLMTPPTQATYYGKLPAKSRQGVDVELFQSWLFWGARLLGRARLLGLPEVALDGEGIDAHGHGLAGNLSEAFAVRAVLVDAFDHRHGDGAGPVASQARQLFCLSRKRVECPELATRITEEDEEMVGFALLNFLKLKKIKEG